MAITTRNIVSISHLEPEIHQWLKDQSKRRAKERGTRPTVTPWATILNEVLLVGMDRWLELDRIATEQGLDLMSMIELSKKRNPTPE